MSTTHDGATHPRRLIAVDILNIFNISNCAKTDFSDRFIEGLPPRCDGVPATWEGTPNDDLLTGTPQ